MLLEQKSAWSDTEAIAPMTPSTKSTLAQVFYRTGVLGQKTWEVLENREPPRPEGPRGKHGRYTDRI